MLNLPDAIINYLNEERAPLPAISDPDQPLQMDSLALMRFIAFLESDFNVVVEDYELVAENFENLHTLAALIGPKLRARAKAVQTDENDAQPEH